MTDLAIYDMDRTVTRRATYTPFLLGLFISLLFIGLLLHWWLFTAAMAMAGSLALVAWLWPEKALAQRAARGDTHG